MENTNREIAIKMTGVKKRYRLGQIGGGTLQADLQSWWARLRGKEDPNTKIGEETRLVGQTFMALNGIDLEIYRGEAVGIIGTNGAGKSTMLKLLSRVTAPTEGEIDIYGRIASMLEVGTGFSPEMTGRENVYMNGAILGMTKAEIDAKMEDIIEFSEVRDFIDTPVKRYSSGMYVKLAFSVASHLDSEIMIMDEVLAVGDMAFQRKCLTKMKEAATKDGRTVLYVSHNMNTIRQLCERCIVLDKGKVIFVGDVEEAIGVYLNAKSNSEAFVNLSDVKRDSEFSKHAITMKSLSVVNNNCSVFSVGDKIDFELSFEPDKDMDDVHFRMMIKTIDGIPVTMQTTSNPFKVFGKTDNTIKFTLDISNIVPGRYSLSPVFYNVNDIGINIYLDGLKDVYCFEIVPTPQFNNNMEWLPRYWGNVYNKPLEIKLG